MRRRSVADSISTVRPWARSTAALRSRIRSCRSSSATIRPPGRASSRSAPSSASSPAQRRIEAIISGSVGAKPRVQPRPARGTARAGSGRGCCRNWRRGGRVDFVALDQEDLGSATRKIVGDRGAGETAADDQDVGPGRARFRFAGQHREPIVPAVRGNGSSGSWHGNSAAATRSRSHPSPRTARRSTCRLAAVRRLAAGGRSARHHHPGHHGRVPHADRRGAAGIRRDHGQLSPSASRSWSVP